MLKSSVKPTHYNLTFKPNAKTFAFDGKAEIDFQVLQKTDSITLHALKLQISDVFVRLPNSTTEFFPKTKTFNETDETVTFLFPHLIEPGTVKLVIDFVGALSDNLKGFYRSKYFVDGEARYAFVTQLAPTDGRRMFPCIDEPAMKATFDITLIVEKHLTGLSNMPVVSEFEDNNGFKVLKYDRTPVMSTYLVALCVGEFDYVEKKSEDGVTCRVYTPLGKKDHGRFALETATRVLPYYKDYFGIGYPLKKLDLIAVADFALGAMENWGLITFTEIRILVDPKNTSLSVKQAVASIIAHEISHQWFGNLVTMEWWTHLWLNEGFATFIQFLCTDALFPEYQMWPQFVSGMYGAALQLDSLRNSHPIEVPVKSSSEIDEIFDAISYNKGASVIRMLHDFMGDADFRKGMNLYLTRHAYGNTVTEDLWKALSECSSATLDVPTIMSNWVGKVGFPLVSVVKSEQKDGKRILTLKQERFVADGTVIDDETLWSIPLKVATAKKTISCSFDKKTIEIEVDEVSDSQAWIKINPGTVTFCRVQYLPEMLKAFETHKVIKDKVLSPVDRLGLVDDLFALVKAGKTNTTQFLQFLQSFTDETEYVVWKTICTCLSKLRSLLSSNLASKKTSYNNYCQKLFKKIYSQLLWDPRENDTNSDTLLRPLIISQLIESNCPKTISEAVSRFNESPLKVPADLRQCLYKGVLSHANVDALTKVIKLYQESTSQEEQERIYGSFGQLDDPKVIEAALEFAMTIRSTDSARAMGAIASGAGREIAWEYFKTNVKVFQEKFGEGTYIVPRLVQNLTQNFASTEKMKEVEAFFKENAFSGVDRTVQQSLETIKLNEAWLERDLESILEYLKDY